jgi:site-specific DNA-methyltransferase (adenine-specific)
MMLSWYGELLKDLRFLEWTGIVATKHAMGKRILRDEQKFGRPEYGSKRMENLARDLKVSVGELYRCVDFARKIPELSPTVRGLSWRYIANHLLPTPTRARPATPPLPAGTYEVLLSDPPWDHEWRGGWCGPTQHYDVMSTEEIAALPVPAIAAPNCILFLWAVFPLLPDAFSVMDAWGFRYATVGFVWIKSLQDGTGFASGLGYWTRANAEVCLIGIRGQVSRQDERVVSQIVYSPREQHSKKPDAVRERIVELVGDRPRIELFARDRVPGWDAWGLEADREPAPDVSEVGPAVPGGRQALALNPGEIKPKEKQEMTR